MTGVHVTQAWPIRIFPTVVKTLVDILETYIMETDRDTHTHTHRDKMRSDKEEKCRKVDAKGNMEIEKNADSDNGLEK